MIDAGKAEGVNTLPPEAVSVMLSHVDGCKCGPVTEIGPAVDVCGVPVQSVIETKVIDVRCIDAYLVPSIRT